MKVTELEIHDVKSVRWVKLKPTDGLTLISGDNGAGKSTILDSVCMALGGKSLVPEKPIRDGETSAVISLKLDGDPSRLLPPIEVVRRFEKKPDGTTDSELTIYDTTDDERTESPSPQTLLNDVLGRTSIRDIPIGFDPLSFSRMPPKQQIDLLRSLVGLDLSNDDEKIRQLTEQRAQIGREGKRLAGALQTATRHDIPDDTEDVQAVYAALEEAKAHNAIVQSQKAERVKHIQRIEHVQSQIRQVRDRVATLEETLRATIREREKLVEDLKELEAIKSPAPMQEIPAEQFLARIEAARDVAEKRKENVFYDNTKAECDKLRAEYESLTAAIKSAQDAKRTKMESAAWPIERLGFDESGVTFCDRPLAQASSAEQLEISVAIGCAMNPSLKIMLVREGSLLDAKHQESLAALAKKYGAQIFVELVGERAGSQIIMRDGVQVAGQAKV